MTISFGVSILDAMLTRGGQAHHAPRGGLEAYPKGGGRWSPLLRRLEVEPGLTPAELRHERRAHADEADDRPGPDPHPGEELEDAQEEEADRRGVQGAEPAVEEVDGDPVAEGVEDGDRPPELEDDAQEDD